MIKESRPMKLNILLRTCNRAENNPDMKRIIRVSRDELILRCTKSLITSINNLTVDPENSVKVTIFDDSNDVFNGKIQKLLVRLKSPLHLERVKQTNNESMIYCYEYAMKNFSDDSLIYFCEDDSLYFPNCFEEMIAAYKIFKHNLGRNSEVAINPMDSPLEYFAEALASPYSQSRIVLGRDRHWRTAVSCPFTILITKKAFNQHYDKFIDYSKFDGINFHEANTINLMFVDNVHLFTPIPTLAFGIQYIDPPAPHCDYRKLWESNMVSL